jgi:hypothetical protein
MSVASENAISADLFCICSEFGVTLTNRHGLLRTARLEASMDVAWERDSKPHSLCGPLCLQCSRRACKW